MTILGITWYDYLGNMMMSLKCHTILVRKFTWGWRVRDGGHVFFLQDGGNNRLEATSKYSLVIKRGWLENPPFTYWCLVGNGWEWGLLGLLIVSQWIIPSFPHSLIPSHSLLPSGNLTVCYWTWPFIVDFPIKHGGSFNSYVKLPEGKHKWISQPRWMIPEPL